MCAGKPLKEQFLRQLTDSNLKCQGVILFFLNSGSFWSFIKVKKKKKEIKGRRVKTLNFTDISK